MDVTPSSSDPDHLSTSFSIITSNTSPGLKGLDVMQMASLNSDNALGLLAVRQLLDKVVLRPCNL
jgi:hypothetical protein